MAASEVGQSESLPLLQQLLHCIAALTSAAATNSHLHSSALFSVLLRIAASPHALTLKLQVHINTVWIDGVLHCYTAL